MYLFSIIAELVQSVICTSHPQELKPSKKLFYVQLIWPSLLQKCDKSTVFADILYI